LKLHEYMSKSVLEVVVISREIVDVILVAIVNEEELFSVGLVSKEVGVVIVSDVDVDNVIVDVLNDVLVEVFDGVSLEV
jgi:hypothetical protein